MSTKELKKFVTRIKKANNSFGVMGSLMLAIDFEQMNLTDLLALQSMIDFKFSPLEDVIVRKQ